MIFVTTRSFASIIHIRGCSDLFWLGKFWMEYTKSLSSIKFTIDWKAFNLHLTFAKVIKYQQQCSIENIKDCHATDMKYISLVC